MPMIGNGALHQQTKALQELIYAPDDMTNVETKEEPLDEHSEMCFVQVSEAQDLKFVVAACIQDLESLISALKQRVTAEYDILCNRDTKTRKVIESELFSMRKAIQKILKIIDGDSEEVRIKDEKGPLCLQASDVNKHLETSASKTGTSYNILELDDDNVAGPASTKMSSMIGKGALYQQTNALRELIYAPDDTENVETKEEPIDEHDEMSFVQASEVNKISETSSSKAGTFYSLLERTGENTDGPSSTGKLELQSGSRNLSSNPDLFVDCFAEFSDTASDTTTSAGLKRKGVLQTNINSCTSKTLENKLKSYIKLFSRNGKYNNVSRTNSIHNQVEDNEKSNKDYDVKTTSFITENESNVIMKETTVSNDQRRHSNIAMLEEHAAAEHCSLKLPMQDMAAISNATNNCTNNMLFLAAREFTNEQNCIKANGDSFSLDGSVATEHRETPSGGEKNCCKTIGQRTLQCEYCQYETHNSYHMKVHARNHTGGRLQCPHCEYKTCRSDALKSHVRKHTGDRLQCPHCEYKACRSDALKSHIRQHTGDMLQCQHCDYKTCYSSNLKKHQRRKHSRED